MCNHLSRKTLAAVVFCARAFIVSACQRNYTCKTNGKEYDVGQSWMEGCTPCSCKGEGTKATWCNAPVPCSDGGSDGDALRSMGSASAAAPQN
jgi:hypothetical protein